MGTSILTSTKKLLGIGEDYTHFDLDVITSINSAFSTLTQLGVGPIDGFSIVDDTAEWEDYLDDNSKLSLVKSYVYMKVRVIFDPPNTGFVLTAVQEQIKEAEWRLNVFSEVENYVPEPVSNEPVVPGYEGLYPGF